MHLADFYSPDTISVDLQGRGKDEILAELVGLLRLDERSTDTLLRMLQRRETLGSTGVGRGIAIPHCRSLVVNRRPPGLRAPQAGAWSTRLSTTARFSISF